MSSRSPFDSVRAQNVRPLCCDRPLGPDQYLGFFARVLSSPLLVASPTESAVTMILRINLGGFVGYLGDDDLACIDDNMFVYPLLHVPILESRPRQNASLVGV
jgi:hypothetical protein